MACGRCRLVRPCFLEAPGGWVNGLEEDGGLPGQAAKLCICGPHIWGGEADMDALAFIAF